MKQIFLIGFLFLISCSAGEENSGDYGYLSSKEFIDRLHNATLQSEHLQCVVQKKYYSCDLLSHIYSHGGSLRPGEPIKPDKQKAKFYNELLCNEYKEEYYCKQVELNKQLELDKKLKR